MNGGDLADFAAIEMGCVGCIGAIVFCGIGVGLTLLVFWMMR